MGRYTDTWISRQWAADPDRFTVHTPPDPAHGDLSDSDPVLTAMETPIAAPYTGIHTDAIFENVSRLPESDPIDRTPGGGGTGPRTAEEAGHGYGGTTVPIADDHQSVEILGAGRGRDDGAPRRQTGDTLTHLRGRFFDEQWSTPTSEGARTTGMADQPGAGYEQLRRGLNADPINDGDSGRPGAWPVDVPSWKVGRYQREVIQRTFRPTSWHRGDGDEIKYAQERTVTQVGDAPPPVKSDKYSSPFSSLQRFLPRAVRLDAGIRRQPGSFDEAVVAAGAPSIPSGDWSGVVVVN